MRPTLHASGRHRGEVPTGIRIVEELPRMLATPEEPRERPGLKGGGMAAF